MNNLLDLFKETLIQKPVSLVKDQHLNALQAEAGSVLDVIDKTERNINYVMRFFFVSLRDSIPGPLERLARAQTAMLCRSPML